MPNLSITTTQNVKLFFTPASVGERMLAYAIDWVIQAAYLLLVFLLFLSGMEWAEVVSQREWVVISMLFALLLPVVFYHLIFESIMEGQSLGKRVLKIKVVKIDGYQAVFFDYFIRWVFRLVDVGMMYLPGLTALIITRYSRRLGDLAAGTAVISEKSKYDISHTILMDVEADYQPHFSQSQVLLFSDNDMRIVKENARKALLQKDDALMNRLVQKIESVMGVSNPFGGAKEFVSRLLRDYDYFTGK